MTGQPKEKAREIRRRAGFTAPIPKRKQLKQADTQQEFIFDEGAETVQYAISPRLGKLQKPNLNFIPIAGLAGSAAVTVLTEVFVTLTTEGTAWAKSA